jgi:hypothetical protein
MHLWILMGPTPQTFLALLNLVFDSFSVLFLSLHVLTRRSVAWFLHQRSDLPYSLCSKKYLSYLV